MYEYIVCVFLDEWHTLEGVLSLSVNQTSFHSTIVTNCMSLCQKFACHSLAYNTRSRICYLRAVHTSSSDVTLVDHADVITMDRYTFGGEYPCSNKIVVRIRLKYFRVVSECNYRLLFLGRESNLRSGVTISATTATDFTSLNLDRFSQSLSGWNSGNHEEHWIKVKMRQHISVYVSNNWPTSCYCVFSLCSAPWLASTDCSWPAVLRPTRSQASLSSFPTHLSFSCLTSTEMLIARCHLSSQIPMKKNTYSTCKCINMNCTCASISIVPRFSTFAMLPENLVKSSSIQQ